MNNKCEGVSKTVKIYSNVNASSYCLQTVVKGILLSRSFREKLHAWRTVNFIAFLTPAWSVISFRKRFHCSTHLPSPPKTGIWFYETLCKYVFSDFTERCRHPLPLHQEKENGRMFKRSRQQCSLPSFININILPIYETWVANGNAEDNQHCPNQRALWEHGDTCQIISLPASIPQVLQWVRNPNKICTIFFLLLFLFNICILKSSFLTGLLKPASQKRIFIILLNGVSQS